MSSTTTTTTMVRRIARTYRMATPDELAEGLEWYARARREAERLDPERPERAAGVLAGISPLMPWERNVVLTRLAYATGTVTGGLPANMRKAQRILDGEAPLDVLSGPKVRAFYRVIVEPSHPDAVVVDRHAHDIAAGRVCSDDERGTLATKAGYAQHVDAFRRAARRLGVTPSQVQAVTWVVWRNVHAVGWAQRDALVA